MKITPLDIRQQRFSQQWRGYVPAEVHDFLQLVADDVEQVVRENMFLEDELGKKSSQLQIYRERENTLKDTMLTAQKVTEEMRAVSKKEAELLLSEAAMEAEKIVAQAHERVVQLRQEIHELKQERLQSESELRHLLTTHLRLLDLAAEVEADAATGDDTLEFLRRAKSTGE